MKNLFTLFLVAITALSFAQQQDINKTRITPKQFKVMPNSARPVLHRSVASPSRTSGACDTVDILDQSTYNEVVANNLQISFHGSWNGATPAPYANEINSSFITINNADNGVLSYVMTGFDSLAFADYNNSTVYSKAIGSSTVSLDSLGIFMGISADDTSVTGGLAGDSLVFNIYPINNGTITLTPAVTKTFAGHDALAPFVTGTSPDLLRYCQIQVNHQFAQGQGFAVRMDFYSSDTSSHCLMSYSYADSCQQIVYQGNTYASPAYPSPFINSSKISGNRFGNTYYGEIDSTTPSTATVTDISNGAYYINIPGIPSACNKLYIENWEFLPFVTVTSTLGITINGSNPLQLACPATSHAITVAKTGDLANAVYSWSSNVTGSHSTANTSIIYPGTYDVTVTNSQGCTATDELVAAYASGTTATANFNVPSEICQNIGATFTNTSSDTTNFTSTWNFGQGVDSIVNGTTPTYTYTNTGTYPVSLTIKNSAGCAFGITQTVTVLNCVGIQDVAFDNAISILPNPSNGSVNITINNVDKDVTLTVYNVVGEVVKSFATTQSSAVFNKALDLSTLSNGTYLVKIQSGSKTATKKLVITK